MKVLNKHYLLLSLSLLIIEISIAIFAKDQFIRPIFGDYLATIFLFCIMASVLNYPKNMLILVALLVSYLIEMLQFLNILQLMNLEKNKFLKIIIGNSFSWLDILAYTMGAITVLFLLNYKKILR